MPDASYTASVVQTRISAMTAAAMQKALASREQALLGRLKFPIKGIVQSQLGKVEAEIPQFADEFVSELLAELSKMQISDVMAWFAMAKPA